MRNKPLIFLIVILAVASALRLYDLPRGDVISDEVLYGFRAIGYLDFDFAVDQPSTPQLLEAEGVVPPPTWTQLSFHDHPPLVFLVQHWFMNFFGVNLWGLRLSSALFGVASIALVYVVGRKLFAERVGLVAAAVMAVNVLMLYVSRTAMQESQVIFLLLLTVYFFIKARNDPRWYLGVGAVLGLGILSKYTVIFLAVPLLFITLRYRREILSTWHVYAGVGIAVLFAAPVIVYNSMLFKAFGHFDFQLSHIVGQSVAAWQSAPGKEIGTVAERAAGIATNFWEYGSAVFSIMALAGLGFLGYTLSRRSKEVCTNAHVLLASIILANLLLYLAIGPGIRFLTMIVPWLALAIGLMAHYLIGRMQNARLRGAVIAGVIVVLIWEAMFAVNSYLLYRPIGPEIAVYSKIHWDMHPYGFNELDAFLDDVYAGAYPALTIPYKFQFLETVKEQARLRAEESMGEPHWILTVYDGNISGLASLWVFAKRSLYQSHPIITAENYLTARTAEGDRFYEEAGFEELYFIRPADGVLLTEPERRTDAGEQLEAELMTRGVEPMVVANHAGEEAFRVYVVRSK